SLDEMQYFFIAYDYDMNYIFAERITDVKDATIIKAFDKIFTKLTEKGHKPTFNVTDNQAATPLKAYLKSEGCKWQLSNRTTIVSMPRNVPSKHLKTISSAACAHQMLGGHFNCGTRWRSRQLSH
ncbi:MAG: hypothetical protein GY874_22135, partial [Desulfobacteraceae bacterium]|nr:hypothetical protein [Desulfobacteraceae bacterium]